MTSNRQIEILVTILLLLGFGAAAYKHHVLGFPLLVSESETIWAIEAKVTFDVDEFGQPVEVQLNLPDDNPQRKLAFVDVLSDDYDFKIREHNGIAYAQWKSEKVADKQTLYLRSERYFTRAPSAYKPELLTPSEGVLEGSLLRAAESLYASRSETDAGFDGRVRSVLELLNRAEDSNKDLLIREAKNLGGHNWLQVQLLSMAGIPANTATGLLLEDKKRNQKLYEFVEVYDGKVWHVWDAKAAESLSWESVVILQRGEEPILEVFGGSNSKLSFSTLRQQRALFKAAVSAANLQGNPLVDFSIYSLPVEEQNTFKMLLLIPLGALVVVVLRNLVGIRTSGTFMPVLIAMTFVQTSLLTGLGLFIGVVGVGLLMRSYLSRLNLLLVPRIASVLVFVIIIYAAIGIASYKLGIEWGLKVTLFPMIILSWTIERMSILWEEEGAHEVFIQGGGSLLTASIAFFLMSNTMVSDTVFLYPELLLVVLAIIISIGSYSGYRLSDLTRFEPMQRY